MRIHPLDGSSCQMQPADPDTDLERLRDESNREARHLVLGYAAIQPVIGSSSATGSRQTRA